MSGNGPSREALLAKFRGIGRERVARLNRDVVALEQRPDEEELAQAVMREIHTLKGEAKLLGLANANRVAHVTEEVLLRARDRSFRVPGDWFDAVFTGLDLLGVLVEREGGDAATASIDLAPFLRRAAAAAGLQSDGTPAVANAGAAVSEPTPTPSAPVLATSAASSPKSDSAPSDARPADSVRIDSEKLDRLTELVGDAVVGGASWHAVLASLGELRVERAGAMRQLARQLARLGALDTGSREALVLVARAAQEIVARDEELDDRLARLLATANEDSFEHKLRLDELEGRIRDLRLVPVASLLWRYARAVRDLGREKNKSVQAEIHDTRAEADKQVLEALEDVLLHLVRNAVDHGIEPADARQRAGKPVRGTITLGAEQRGSTVVVTVADDGGGIDLDVVRRTAVARGLVSATDARDLDERAVHELLFQPGFSTREAATDVSGRGIGLDVVRQRTMALGGSVRLESAAGRGTRFEVTVPTAVALLPAMIVRVGGTRFGLPSDSIERILEITEADTVPTAGGTAVRVDADFVPLFDLAALFGITVEAPPRRRPLMLLRHDGQLVGIGVSAVEGERQLVQRPLDPFLSALRIVSGTSILEHGDPLLLLNVPHLVRLAQGGRTATPSPSAEGERRSATILVVDDSEMVRDMLVGALKARGYRVIEAVNGRDALSRLTQGLPDLVITDLDMPVLDGFGLLATLRGRAEAAGLPVIVLTSRDAGDPKRRALELGADAYITKAEFKEAELMQIVERFLGSGGR